MSRSPRPNQLGSTPYAASSSLACQVSCRRPQPRSGSMPSPRVYITVSRSGHTLSPCTQMSSAVLATTVTEVARAGALDEAQQSLQEARPADAAGEHGDARGEPCESDVGECPLAGSDGDSDMVASVDQLGPIPDFRLTSGYDRHVITPV